MDVDLPEVVAQVRAVFEDYERAFVANDIAALNAYFLDAPTTIRYGVADRQLGMDEIKAYRRSAPTTGLERRLGETVITTYGHNLAVASTLFFRDSAPGKTGRQMQTWIRTPDGWRIVAAHVSLVDEPA
jgi:ketosteroid isomerase-like protein